MALRTLRVRVIRVRFPAFRLNEGEGGTESTSSNVQDHMTLLMVFEQFHLNRSLNSLKEVECPEPVEGTFLVYLLKCGDDSIYCGSTFNLKNRLREHMSGEAATWTKMLRPVKLAYFEAYDSLISARRREKQIKGWTAKKKENLINGIWKKQ